MGELPNTCSFSINYEIKETHLLGQQRNGGGKNSYKLILQKLSVDRVNKRRQKMSRKSWKKKQRRTVVGRKYNKGVFFPER